MKYNFVYWKIKLYRILWHYVSMQFGCLIKNPVKDIWAALLCELFRIESTVYFLQNLLVMITKWSVNCQVQFSVRKIKLDRILWDYVSMQFGWFIQNPVQDTWTALLCELFRIESTVYFSQNFLWTRSSASLCWNHSVSFWICLCVVFLKMRLLWVQMHCFGEVR